MPRVIRPIAIQLGIIKHFGWHSFTAFDPSARKQGGHDAGTAQVMQKLLRLASSRITMDTYAAQKREVQSGVIRLFRVRPIGPKTEG